MKKENSSRCQNEARSRKGDETQATREEKHEN